MLSPTMEWALLWFGLAIVVGVAANTRGRDGVGWFLLAVIISPLFAGLLVLALPRLAGPLNTSSEKVCPYCAERVQRAAVVCRYCGSSLEGVDEIIGQPVLDQQKPEQWSGILTSVVVIVLIVGGLSGLSLWIGAFLK